MIVYEKKDLAGPLISPTKASTLHKTWMVYEREREVQDFGEKSKVTKTHHHWHHRNETQDRRYSSVQKQLFPLLLWNE